MVAPLSDGALQTRATDPSGLAVAAGAGGVEGGVAGVTALDPFDGDEVPSEIVAVIVNVYEVPRDNPVIVVEVGAGSPEMESPVQLTQAGSAATV